ncbi:MAG: DNA-formamidopyrimidine glycosylase family protein, partial [bacterium]
MPELPEVETPRQELDKILTGRIIKNVEVLYSKAVFPLSAEVFKKNLLKVKIENVDRRAKMLFFHLSNNKFLAFHLKMTGQLIYVPYSGKTVSGDHPTADIQTPGKHTRLIFTLDDKSHLYFNDLRKFGWSRLLDKNQLDTATEHYGPEPLSKNFTPKFLIELFKQHPKTTIKKSLLDQT